MTDHTTLLKECGFDSLVSRKKFKEGLDKSLTKLQQSLKSQLGSCWAAEVDIASLKQLSESEKEQVSTLLFHNFIAGVTNELELIDSDEIICLNHEVKDQTKIIFEYNPSKVKDGCYTFSFENGYLSFYYKFMKDYPQTGTNLRKFIGDNCSGPDNFVPTPKKEQPKEKKITTILSGYDPSTSICPIGKGYLRINATTDIRELRDDYKCELFKPVVINTHHIVYVQELPNFRTERFCGNFVFCSEIALTTGKILYAKVPYSEVTEAILRSQ